MLSTDGSYTITAEGNSSKCLLVLHKPKVGTKIGWQTGKSEPSFGGRPANDIGQQSRPLCSFRRTHAVFAEVVLGICGVCVNEEFLWRNIWKNIRQPLKIQFLFLNIILNSKSEKTYRNITFYIIINIVFT